MKSSFSLSLLLGVLLISCNTDKTMDNDFVDLDISPNECFTEQSFAEVIPLSAEKFNDSVIHNPRSLSLVKEFLFSVDVSGQTDTLVRYYSLPNKEYQGAVYLQGQGPMEMLSPSTVHASADSSSFWIYDTAKRAFAGQPLPGTCRLADDEEKVSFIHLNDTLFRGVDDVLWLDKKRLVVSDLFHYKERFFIADTCMWDAQAVTNSSLHFKNVYGDRILADIFSTRKCMTPDHSRIILAGSYLDLLEIYDKEGRLLHMVKGPEKDFQFEFDIERSQANNVLIKSRNSRRAYLAVKATNDKIYALYSGKTKEDKEHYSYSRALYVFSSDGEPLKKYQLDTPVIDFVVDEANGMIYAASDNAEIVGFRIRN